MPPKTRKTRADKGKARPRATDSYKYAMVARYTGGGEGNPGLIGKTKKQINEMIQRGKNI